MADRFKELLAELNARSYSGDVIDQLPPENKQTILDALKIASEAEDLTSRVSALEAESQSVLWPNIRAAERLLKEKGEQWEADGHRIVALESRLAEVEAENARLKAAIELAARDEVFFSKDHETGEIEACILCNDTFFYATADFEPIKWDDVVKLFELSKADPAAALKWAIESRGLKPLPETDAYISKVDRVVAERTAMQARLEKAEALLRSIDLRPAIIDITNYMGRHLSRQQIEAQLCGLVARQEHIDSYFAGKDGK